MSSSEQPPDPDRSSSKAAERLAVIVDAAERAALNVIDDAEKEAQRYLVEAKVRADRIVAERLREAADQIERGAGGAAAMPRLRPVVVEPPTPEETLPPREAPIAPRPEPVKDEPEPARPDAVKDEVEPTKPDPIGEAGDGAPKAESEPQAEQQPPTISPPAPPAKPRIVESPPPPRQSGSAAARLLATQMAVSGSSRGEIELRLRSGFDIADTSEILDAILGPEGDGDA